MSATLAFTCLALAIYFEAQDQSLKGQVAVAQVVLNRMESDDFPDDMCGVIFDGGEEKHKCQFSWYCDGKPDTPDDTEVWEYSKWVTQLVLNEGVRMSFLAGVVFYHADWVDPEWEGVDFVIQIGNHLFYRPT